MYVESASQGWSAPALARLILGATGVYLASLCLGLVLWAMVPSLLMGWERALITTGSMEPSIKPGDIVLMAPAVADEIDPGAVVTFIDPVDGEATLHRVVSRNDDGDFRTKGDANRRPDSSLVSSDSILGEGKLLIPLVGTPLLWAKSGSWVETSSFVAVLILGAFAIWWGLAGDDSRNRERQRNQPVPRRLPVAGAGILSGSVLVLALISGQMPFWLMMGALYVAGGVAAAAAWLNLERPQIKLEISPRLVGWSGRAGLSLLFGALLIPALLGTETGTVSLSRSALSSQTLNSGNSFNAASSFEVELLGTWLTGLSHTAEAGDERALVFVGGNEHIGQVESLGGWGTGLSHSAEAGSDRLLVFIAGNEHSTAAVTLDSVSYGGQALNKANSISVGATVTAHVEIWYLDESGIAAASNSTFIPTWSATPDNPMYSHAFFGGVDQASPIGTQDTASADSSTPNPITTGVLGDDSGDLVVVGAVAGETGSYTPQNGFSLGNNQAAASTTTLGTAYKSGSGAGETPSMLHSGPNRQVIAAVELNAEPVPAPTLTSVTYGGQSLTKVNDIAVGTTFKASVEIWILDEAGIAAATGSTFVPTWSDMPNLPMYSHAFFGGVDQVTPTGAQATNSTGTSTPNPITTTGLATNDGDMVVVGAVGGDDGTFTPQNGFLLGNNQNLVSTTTMGTAYKAATGATETPSMSHSSPNRRVIAAVVLSR